MNSKNKLAEMPIRSLLYTMAIPLMLCLIVQSLYNIVDSIFVAKLSETALIAASLVYAIQFLMIAVGVGTAVGLNALLSRIAGSLQTISLHQSCLLLGDLSANLCSATVTGCWGYCLIYAFSDHRCWFEYHS